MPYSLLDRFRGLLIGAVLGEGWARDAGGANAPGRLELNRSVALPLAAAIATQIQGLITGPTTLPEPGEPDRWLAATLPLALWHHDASPPYLQSLQPALPASVEPSLGRLSGVIGQGIAIAMQPRMAYPNPMGDLPVAAPLPWVQRQIRERQCLATVVNSLQTHTDTAADYAVALAFYAWLSTPHQFSLGLRRVAQVPAVPPLALLFTGALVGATVGLSGIPPTWIAPMDPVIAPPEQSLPHWLAQADRLLAHWAGCLPEQVNMTPWRNVAISAPRRLRPR